ncbi:helix-turn-helix transcriptional regulator [Streptomyces sp. NPDC093111]|uniref:TOBE domain-containing protein n=1 Tax=Streptomyces sp. NPDC093111 TaxID=3154978 RepID=UPI00342CD24C
MPSYSMGQAAKLLGVSAETVRRWADGGRLPFARDAAGARAVEGADLARFAVARGAGPHAVPEDDVPTSVRNAFVGIVTAVRVDDVAARVEVQSGPHRLVSLVTREAVEELGLAVGITVTARVKSTSVHVGLP